MHPTMKKYRSDNVPVSNVEAGDLFEYISRTYLRVASQIFTADGPVAGIDVQDGAPLGIAPTTVVRRVRVTAFDIEVFS